MDRIHNLYITSQNNKLGNTNYNYNLYFSSYGINIDQDEEAYLNITSFQSLNTFYNINDKSNTFQIKYVSIQEATFTYSFTLENGNYNIQEFQDTINELCSQYFTITYDTKKNKWKYVNTGIVGSDLFIIPNQYNYKYFGLYIETNRTLDNISKNISSGDIYALITRQDNAVNSLINWQDFNGTFKKKIANNEINYLNFIFTDEYNNPLLELNDWLLTLTIIIQKKQYQPVPMQME